MKYILLLSFLLAFLPDQNPQRQEVDRRPDFIAVFDQVQALPANDQYKKPENQDSEPFLHFHVELELNARNPMESIALNPLRSLRIVSIPYAIRAPPQSAFQPTQT